MIREYTLKGDGKVKEIVISEIGAAIRKLVVEDRNGGLKDIVLGFDTGDDYYNNPAFFGTVVGAIANRTKNGSFDFRGKTYTLPQNEGSNNLHTDFETGLHKKIFSGKEEGNSIILTLDLKDMEDGLPGNRRIEIIYTLENDEFNIEYTMLSDKDTVYDPTNHSYFNLNGHDSGNIFTHSLKLDSDFYTAIDGELIPTGELVDVADTEFDYRSEKKLMLPEHPLDHNFVRRGAEEFGEAAVLYSPDSGIGFELISDLPGLQVYMGGSIPSIKGKDGAMYSKHSGIALETQFFPNCVNEGQTNPAFAFPLVKAGERSYTRTAYRFFIR